MKGPAISVFENLARAEAKVHGGSVEAVHFHEVGALDAVADIVGACLCLAALMRDAVYFSALPVGGGLVQSAHGILPVPAPATLELMRGCAVWDPGEQQELVTPTGAAIVTTIGTQRLNWPSMTVEAIGVGAGSRDTPRPNFLRAVVGTEARGTLEAKLGGAAGHHTAIVSETNVHDATGQVVAHAVERLLARGALDAWWSPCGMKRGGPGTQVTFLSRPEDVAGLVEVAFQEPPTLGVRTYATDRHVLDREAGTVETPYGPVRIKTGKVGGRVLTVTPEYEDCQALAGAHGVPVRAVIQAAEAVRGSQAVKASPGFRRGSPANLSRESTGGFLP